MPHKINRRWFIRKTGLAVPMLMAAPALAVPPWVKLSGGWNPSVPGTLVQWLKADSIAQAGGSSVSTWPAIVGSNGTGTGSPLPTLQANNQNGLPVVRMNGSSNYIALSGSAVPQTFTIAMTYRFNGSTAGINLMLEGGSSSNSLYSNSAGNIKMGQGVTLVATNNNFHLIFMVFNGASSKFGFDGAALTTVSSTIGTCQGPVLTLGTDFSATFFSQIDVGELALWAGDGSTYYSSAATYFNNRWGV